MIIRQSCPDNSVIARFPGIFAQNLLSTNLSANNRVECYARPPSKSTTQTLGYAE